MAKDDKERNRKEIIVMRHVPRRGCPAVVMKMHPNARDGWLRWARKQWWWFRHG